MVRTSRRTGRGGEGGYRTIHSSGGWLEHGRVKAFPFQKPKTMEIKNKGKPNRIHWH